MRTRTPLSALTLAGLLVLTACSGGQSSAQNPADATPVDGGNLTFAISVDSGCIDPQQVGNNDALNIGRQLVDSLTVQDLDGKIQPWLAQSWEVSPDATTFTFHLRQGATFSDGTPVDSAAVKANLDGIVALGAKASLGSTYLQGYTGTQTPDPQTAVVTFSAPSAQFLQATSTMSLGLLSVPTTTADPATRCDGSTLVGSGPFTVGSYTKDDKTVLDKRKGYDWAPTGSKHSGEAHLDSITYQVVPEASVRTGSLQSKQIDATTGIASQDLPQFDGNGFWTQRRANPGIPYNFFPNESRPIFSDERVRQAFSKAIDREQLVSILNPDDVAVSSALSASTPAAPDDSAALALDVDGANALLDQAGWVEGADGIREKDGRKLTVTVTFWQSTTAVLELVQQQVRAVGIDLQLKQGTTAETTALQNSGDCDVLFYNLTRSDPDVLRTIFSTETRNVNHRAHSQVDDLLTQQAATPDTAQRAQLVAQASKLLVEDAHSIPLFELSTVIAAHDDVHDLQFEGSSRLWFYDAWKQS
ncbi:ABC transporter substrate-binding protein [Kineococcus aurantiacus]|uniref:Peptide/nickel transport system substrate-binding protein n=1 Tax=Kineococcus aurantiacus TaxID=37633 RepID=A0A7Y9DJ83_9ACTN|nr:ABC transporter substrate-binding protein [Kineococcus aurantiacus]NYD21614.1 peptide/nickel transport system substrate-binding protein [Kineococcus aurantiacus]